MQEDRRRDHTPACDLFIDGISVDESQILVDDNVRFSETY